MTHDPRQARIRTDESFNRVLTLLRQGRDVRVEKIRRLKAALRARRYENDLKLSIAAERMLREL